MNLVKANQRHYQKGDITRRGMALVCRLGWGTKPNMSVGLRCRLTRPTKNKVLPDTEIFD